MPVTPDTTTDRSAQLRLAHDLLAILDDTPGVPVAGFTNVCVLEVDHLVALIGGLRSCGYVVATSGSVPRSASDNAYFAIHRDGVKVGVMYGPVRKLSGPVPPVAIELDPRIVEALNS